MIWQGKMLPEKRYPDVNRKLVESEGKYRNFLEREFVHFWSHLVTFARKGVSKHQINKNRPKGPEQKMAKKVLTLSRLV